MKRTYEEINEKIKSGKAQVLSGQEAKHLIKEKGLKYFVNNIDIVTFALFEMNVNALLYLSFGQTDPLIYISEAYINDVFTGSCGPTDLMLSCASSSKENPEYGGAHVIEDLVKKKDVHLKALGKNLEFFPNKEFETWFNIKETNQAKLFLNQAVNQNNIAAANSGEKDINSPMGTLIGKLENSTYNSSSYLNPLINDPFCKTIGIGSKVWVGGACGIITGSGSNHNPKQKRNECGIPVGPCLTLSCIADLENMNPKWVRGGYLKSYGPVLYIGIGLPVPVLDDETGEHIAINDDKIQTTMVDFSIPRRTKPTFGQYTYAELRTSTVSINKKPTLAAPLSSFSYAIEICTLLKNQILNKQFYLTPPIGEINMNSEFKKLDSRIGEPV